MVKLIIESDETTLQDTDLEGRRPVHIAAVYGSLDVLRLLNTTDVYGENAPLDLAGRTPYGCAKLSGVVSAKRNQGPLDQVLFSPLDPSVKGKPTPHRQRSHRQGEDDLPYGFAQMPGKRVYQEDSVGVHPMPLSSSLLISVCDGHEDNGEMSRYLADNAWDMYSKQPEQLPIEQRWREASLAMDQQLKLKKRRGGSTGVFCLISSNQVVVANVGDCRVILIQKITASNQTTTVTKDNTKEQPVKETEKDQKEEGDHAKTEQEAPPALVEEDSDSTKSFGVIALSDDHKPSLPTEKQRIEAAGLNVKIDSYTDTTGRLQTVYRADLGNGQSLAVSRAFGDFDYKGNTNFSVEEQAIIAIPDVTIHDRTQEDMYVVLACDGIWDVMSNDDVAEFIVEHTEEALKKDESEVLAKVSDKLVAHCLEKGSEDNMSVAIVALSSTSKRIAASGEDNQIRGKTLFK